MLAGIDLDPRSAGIAAAATPPGMAIDWRTGDVFDHVPDPAPDFIVSSQFTHHLTDAAGGGVPPLDGTRMRARGWFIADLHRHVIPYYGFRVLAWLDALAPHHPHRRHDLRRPRFRMSEWRALLAEAGVTEAHGALARSVPRLRRPGCDDDSGRASRAAAWPARPRRLLLARGRAAR